MRHIGETMPTLADVEYALEDYEACYKHIANTDKDKQAANTALNHLIAAYNQEHGVKNR